MQELILTHKKLTILPNEIPDDPEAHRIHYINAANNKINKLTSFQQFSNLQMLNLSHNSLGNCFKSLAYVLEGLDHLKGLSLASNQINTLGEKVFSKCIHIKNLDLSDNKLNSTFRCLTYLHQLQILDLRNNSIDNICNFKPLKQKLINLFCIKLKGNSLENIYQNSHEQVVIREYFPSVEFMITKYSKVKDEDILAKLEQKEQKEINQQDYCSLISSHEVKYTKSRSISINLTSGDSHHQGLRSRSPNKQQRQFDNTQQTNYDVTPDEQEDEITDQQQDPSIIQEEDSQEGSFLSPYLFQFIDSPFSVTLGKSQTKNRLSSCKKQQITSTGRNKSGSSVDRSNVSQKNFTIQQKIERLISKGQLKKETERLQAMLIYKQKELQKVNCSIQDEKRQSLQLQVSYQGFEELVKLTLGIDDDLNKTFFSNALKELKQFQSTIDIFAPDKITNLVKEIISPLLNTEFHDLDLKLVGIQCVIEKLKKCQLMV